MHRTKSSGNNSGNVLNQVIGTKSPGNNPQLAVFRIYISCVILKMSFMHFTCINPYHPMLSISNFNYLLTAFHSEPSKFAYMIFKQNEHSQVNPSDTIPS